MRTPMDVPSEVASSQPTDSLPTHILKRASDWARGFGNRSWCGIRCGAKCNRGMVSPHGDRNPLSPERSRRSPADPFGVGVSHQPCPLIRCFRFREASGPRQARCRQHLAHLGHEKPSAFSWSAQANRCKSMGRVLLSPWHTSLRLRPIGLARLALRRRCLKAREASPPRADLPTPRIACAPCAQNGICSHRGAQLIEALEGHLRDCGAVCAVGEDHPHPHRLARFLPPRWQAQDRALNTARGVHPACSRS